MGRLGKGIHTVISAEFIPVIFYRLHKTDISGLNVQIKKAHPAGIAGWVQVASGMGWAREMDLEVVPERSDRSPGTDRDLYRELSDRSGRGSPGLSAGWADLFGVCCRSYRFIRI